MLIQCYSTIIVFFFSFIKVLNTFLINYIDQMALGIIFFPLIGFLFASLFGFKIGGKGSQVLTIIFMCCTCITSLFLFYIVNLLGFTFQKILGNWIFVNFLIIPWQFLFDPLSCLMLIVINLISLCVHIYSIDYMKEDPHICRFMAYLSLFTFCMNLLVTAGNLLQLFIGWEGVGLCSYLLINFWYTRIQANKAALKAIFMNKIGDLAFLIATFLLGIWGYSLSFDVLFLSPKAFLQPSFFCGFVNITVLDLIGFCLVIAAVGKSAQLGLHTWLPDAMEGPTPVSALIHAATMVTAGIFLLVRFSPLLEYSSFTLACITLIGGFTAIFAATIGLFQNDIKKIIAYSTCSQLGYMMFACGNSCYNVAMFHLFTHAFFKALLFLTAGAIIHSMQDEQDIRKYGGLSKLLPICFACIIIGSLALMGFPFLSGFYSKDIILETSFASYTITGHFAYWLGCFAAFCTAFYSLRLIIFTFLTKTNAYRTTIEKVHESSFFILFPLIFLSFCSIFFGFFFKEMFIGFGSDFWQNSISILPHKLQILYYEYIPLGNKIFPLICSFSGSLLAIFLFIYYYAQLYMLNLTKIGYRIYVFFNRKCFFDKIYTEFFVLPFLHYSNFIFYETFDKGVLEHLGTYNLNKVFEKQNKRISFMQSGLIFQYTYTMFISLLIILIFFIVNFFPSFIITIVFIKLLVILCLLIFFLL